MMTTEAQLRPIDRAARRRRALGVVEKTVLGFVAGAAAAVGVTQLVMLVLRIVELASGPVHLTGVPAAPGVSAGFADATVETISLTVDLPAGGRGALIGAAVLDASLVVGICAVLAVLCVRVFVGRPFTSSVTVGLGVVAILIVAKGMGTPLLNGIANAEAAATLDATQLPVFLVGLDLGPLAWAAALAVVAGAFELGQRLQRDTEGLV